MPTLPTVSLRRLLTAAALPAAVLACGTQAHAQATFEKIAARHQINVGFREDSAPFSYANRDKKPMGYSIDVCEAVTARLAERVGVKDLRINYVPIAVDRVVTFVKNGSVDMLCANMTDTAERREQIAFSRPIFVDHVGIMVRKKDGIAKLEQLAGKQLVAIRSTTAVKAVEDYGQGKSLGWKVEGALNPEAALGQLQLGWAQGYARDSVQLSMQLAGLQDADQYAVLPDSLSSEPIAIALRKDDAAMRELVDKAIADASASGQLAAWYDKWFVQPIPIGKAHKALGIAMSPELKAALAAR
ncbi:MAG: amino acid ABC transporter substrate-binding protein [Proteobacteria bacterium]|nr:amino acid ABC transporter substrate-binding protein [Pseudomonadota bacterium]